MRSMELTQAIQDQLVAWRRDFHMHPELGLETYRTAEIVANELRALGYTVKEGFAKTGLIGVLENGDGPTVMSRVDMDALPIHEDNDAPYCSQEPGKMHACGHDAHVSIGLGVATIMAQNRDLWQGTLVVLFQPGEEGANGAEIMLKEGVFDTIRPDKAVAIHVWNAHPVGGFGVAAGPVMAAAETFRVVITGKGGHAAHPEQAIDPVVIAALMVTALQTVVSRNVGARETAVLTIGSLLAGDAFNVIPPTAELRGTIRTYNPDVREMVLKRLNEIVHGTVNMMGATAEIEMDSLCPAVINDPAVTAVVTGAVSDLFGADTIFEERTMGSEDASFFLNEIPGCYFFIASGPEDYQSRPHHNPAFDIDEQALTNGTAAVVESLFRLLPLKES